MSKLGEAFERLAELVAILRGPNGCPWDRKQTHQSLKEALIEEAHEVAEAIDEGDDKKLCEELGDILLEAVFHARLAEERGAFNLEGVVRGVIEKLISRHPHVFGTEKVETAEEVLRRWQERKERERKEKGEEDSALAGIPKGLPALLRAERLQRRAELAGFKWPDFPSAWRKAEEEWEELRSALDSDDAEAIERELGHFLFALANAVRQKGLSMESALRKANNEFELRFKTMEAALRKEGLDLKSLPLDKMLAAWERAKPTDKEG